MPEEAGSDDVASVGSAFGAVLHDFASRLLLGTHILTWLDESSGVQHLEFARARS
jgi:hypothetical protein